MKYIIIEKKERIGYIILNRPEKRNALNFDMVTEIKDQLLVYSKDESIKVIVIRSGSDTFCAGADLAYLQKMQSNTFEENLEDSEHLMELFYTIYTLNKIVIAQIKGHAIAGGCGLASVCDFSFATPDSLFGYTEVRVGFVPAIVMVFLLRKIGEGKAKELLLSGNLIKAKEALEFGLINKVVEETDIHSFVFDFATKLCKQNSGQSMALTKQMIAAVQAKELMDGLKYAADKNARARNFSDCKQGIEAFLKKQALEW
ncbi:MAG: enoyl-CoA hydratase/isomerase family protein [Cyclobacteriaceae bacterium]|nr:enoyl-CoA hydratase/isomerase family protein [Cyclobacteriaceae bacterium]